MPWSSLSEDFGSKNRFKTSWTRLRSVLDTFGRFLKRKKSKIKGLSTKEGIPGGVPRTPYRLRLRHGSATGLWFNTPSPGGGRIETAPRDTARPPDTKSMSH